jgi:hypothetical protein
MRGLCASVYLAIGLSVAAGVSHAQIGDSYNSREPVACPTGDAAPKEKPTVEQAVLIFRCVNEVEAGYLYLIENVKLEIGVARDFQFGDNYPQIDRNRPVYPIRGSWVEYQCHNIKTYPGAAPNNCAVFDKSNGVGICYTTTFGDWRCQMQAATVQQRPDWVPAPR